MTTIIYYIQQQPPPTPPPTAAAVTSSRKNILYACIRYKPRPPVLSCLLYHLMNKSVN